MYLDRAKELVEELGYILPEHIRPCNEAQVQWFERMVRVQFPLAYWEFLLWAGNGLGDVMVGSEFYFGQLVRYNYREFARRLLEVNHLDSKVIDDHTIIIYSHQGYQFAYIRDDEGSNPPVYYYLEGEGGIILHLERYSDFIERIIIDESQSAHLFHVYDIEALYKHKQPAILVRHLLLNGSIKISEIPDKLFDFVNLEQLDMRYSNLQAISPKITTLAKLKRLELQGNHLSELPGEIGELKNLEILYVANNHLTTILHIIRELPNLQVCYLEGNPIPTAELEQIQREFPRLKLRP